MTIDDVSFTDYDGARCTDIDGEVQSLFTAWDLEEKAEYTDSHINLHYVAGEEGMQFAHTALVRLLSFESPHEGQLHWRRILRKEQVTANVACLSAALDAAHRQKVVSHVFYLQPNVIPDFLQPPG